ncbi:MAG TPA: acyltransferase [Chitinophagaceae bacterium]
MRFRAIDTFRGLAAILVIFFHIPDSKLLAGNQLVAHGYMAVDFFFVLSGFVMSHSYLSRINDVHSAKSFAIKRFRRIYPLHVFTLLVFLCFETARFVVDRFFVPLNTPPFDNCGFASFIGNLTLTHSMGLFDHLSWNLPSWSISVEFYVYIAWALALILFRKKLWLVGLLALPFVAWFIWKFNGNLEYTYDFGFIRCLFGFLLGMYTYLFAKTFDRRMHPVAATITELLILGVTGWLLANIPVTWHWLMPFWFAIVILFFSTETGYVAKLFAHQRLRFLGELSFSYYLTHIVIIRVWDLLFFKVLKLEHTSIIELAFMTAIFSTVQVVSLFTYKYVELRFQQKPKPQPVPQVELATAA